MQPISEPSEMANAAEMSGGLLFATMTVLARRTKISPGVPEDVILGIGVLQAVWPGWRPSSQSNKLGCPTSGERRAAHEKEQVLSL